MRPSDIPVVATYSRGGDTFNFLVTTGPADASSTIALSGDDLVELGFTGVLESIGGGVDRAEEVRYVSQIDISTRESASLAMTVVDAALETLAGVRGGLGAVANRLESTISNLMNISENTSAAMSRVMDADFAQESYEAGPCTDPPGGVGSDAGPGELVGPVGTQVVAVMTDTRFMRVEK